MVTVVALALAVIPAQSGAATAAGCRQMAERCVSRGEYSKAADYYRQEAAIYRRLGDPNAAKAEEMKAERWSTEIGLYVDTEPDRAMLARNYTGAKHEPIYGCYLGAYLAMDDQLSISEDCTTLEDSFAALINRPLSTSYDYHRYGKPFPLKWAKALCARGIAPHIALEPSGGLDEVQDDDYLRRFARDAASCGGPVFLRFAGEMNGSWTPWGGQPGSYKGKFRLVHDVMAGYAPNVAMIWCVNHIPEANIADYYPGDQYVDWVGVNYYSVVYYDNNKARPGLYDSPTAFLKYVYGKYAAKKPIAICEYGASHQAACDDEEIDRTGLAIVKLSQMLSSLPRLFPRVKLIDFFDCNNIVRAMPSRQLNNYSLTDDERVLSAFQRMVRSDYYLRPAKADDPQELPTYVSPVNSGTVLRGTARLSAWIKSYENLPTVVYYMDGKEISRTRNPGEYRVGLETGRYSTGRHTLTLKVIDSLGKCAGSRSVAVSVAK